MDTHTNGQSNRAQQSLEAEIGTEGNFLKSPTR